MIFRTRRGVRPRAIDSASRSHRGLRACKSPHWDPLEPLETRQLLATATWDGGPTGLGTNWHDAANWENDQPPLSNDDAVINVATNPTITITSPVTVNSLICAEAINLSSTLSIAAPSNIDRGLTLTGTLTGAGEMLLGGASSWSAGAMTGSGATRIAAGATLSVAGSVSIDGRRRRS